MASVKGDWEQDELARIFSIAIVFLDQNVAAVNEASGATRMILVIAWLWVGVPLAWGIAQTVIKAGPLFQPRAPALAKAADAAPKTVPASVPADETKKAN